MSERSELPAGWTTAAVDEILEGIEAGANFRCLERPPGEHEVGVLKVSAVTWGRYDEQQSKTCTSPNLVRKELYVRPGDFLFSRANTIQLVGACVIATHTTRRIMLSDKILRFRVPNDLAKWLLWSLRSPDGRREITRLATGNQESMRNIGQQQIRQLRIPLAPKREVRAVVEALESQLTRLDDAVALLERVQRNLKRYRASVLQAAVEGRLVPTEAELARAEGRSYEPASVLLDRVLAERRRRWKESGQRGKYAEPVAPDTAGLPELPEGWCWATAAMLFWDAGYGTSVKCTYDASGPPVLRIPNVNDQRISLDDVKYASDASQLGSDLALEPGDFVFIRTNGSTNLIGRGALVVSSFQRPHYFASYLIRLRLVETQSLPKWFSLVWHSQWLRRQILQDAASSAGQHNVSLGAAQAYAVPLPPAAEQQRILAALQHTDSLASATETTVAHNAARTTRLRQSILKWAFEGKLADQDPADEPAAALLARIRAERAASPAPKTRKPRARRARENT